MLRCVISTPPKPIGSKGWQSQVVGVYFHDAPGQESPFPTPIPVLVEAGEKGYAPGEYRLDPCSFAPKADSYGKLFVSTGRLVLVPSPRKS